MELELGTVLDLTDPAVRLHLSLDLPDLVSADHTFTQEIGEAAHDRRFQAIRSPSATGVDEVLAVFPEKLAGAVIRPRLERQWSSVADIADGE